MNTSKRNTIQQIFVILLCGIAVLLPFHKTLTTWPLMMAALMGIFIGDPAAKWKRLRSGWKIWLFAALYLLFVFAWLISQNTGEAAKDLKLKMAIALIPLLAGAFMELHVKDVKRILFCFVMACTGFALFALSRAIYFKFTSGEEYFYYKDLVSFTLIHPSYIGMFEAFAIIITGIELITNRDSLLSKLKWIYGGIILFLLLFVFLLTAKMAILSLFLFFNIGIFYWVQKRYSYMRSVLVVVIMNLAGIGALLSLPYSRERFKLLFTYNEVAYANSVDSRAEIWDAAMQLVKDHHYLGIGSGDAEDELVTYYDKNHFALGVEERYNTHNQYLQVLVETGLAGLIFFGMILGLSIRMAVREKNILYLAFLLLFMVNIFTESMLKTQSGVVFFAFFNTVLGMYRPSEKAV